MKPKRKLFLATPMFGGQCAGIYADSMCRLYDVFAHVDVVIQSRFLYNASLITTVRNVLAHEFMQSDCSHMLFIDADIGFDAVDVAKLLTLQVPTSPYDVIAGMYLKKNIHWDRVAEAIKLPACMAKPRELNHYTGGYAVETLDGKDYLDRNIRTPVDVAYVGAGFMMIRRATFNLFRQFYPERIYGDDKMCLYFQAEIDDNKYISEDLSFCRLVRRMGGSVWCCPWMSISHFGNHVYGGPGTGLL